MTLREDCRAGTWRLDRDELRAALSDPAVKAVVVNTPQNPTGKVLDEEELGFIAELCRAHDRFAITDENYEHITFDGHRHRCLALCEGMAERTLVVNSISKTGRAPGWRVGWVITPPERTPALRTVHDNLVVQAPTPLQKGSVAPAPGPVRSFAGIAEGYREKRDLLVGGLRGIEWLRVGLRQRGNAKRSRGCGIGVYPSAAARSSTSSAHWFRLLPANSAASSRAVLSELTRNITRHE